MSVLADSGELAMEVVLTLSIVVPLVVLGLVAWYLRKAASRFAAEEWQAAASSEAGDVFSGSR